MHNLNVKTRIWRKYYLVTYPEPRDQHQIVQATDAKLAILFGGYSASKNVLLDDLWVLNYSKHLHNLDSQRIAGEVSGLRDPRSGMDADSQRSRTGSERSAGTHDDDQPEDSVLVWRGYSRCQSEHSNQR